MKCRNGNVELGFLRVCRYRAEQAHAALELQRSVSVR